MRLHRSLPVRPGINEVEAAMAFVHNVDKELARIDAILKQNKGSEAPEELFFKNAVYDQSKEQKREAPKLLDLENIHALFDELIQRASSCLPSSSSASAPSIPTSSVTVSMADSNTPTSYSSSASSVLYSENGVKRNTDWFPKNAKVACRWNRRNTHPSRRLIPNSTTRQEVTSGEESGKLSRIKPASLIEVSAKKGTRDLTRQNKLMDQVDWLPDSIGKLSDLVTLDLSEN
ncbi:unnamed protein product [Musa banksii]